MDAGRRRQALKLLLEVRPTDFRLARQVEALCHSVSSTEDEYWDSVFRSHFNLRQNSNVGANVVFMSDEELAVGTIVGRIETERVMREERFQQMLQDKYDALNDETFQAIVRCRRCGSEEVSWEEKQTRSADEGGTVFCVCTTCKNRWVMR
jgi:DNA-directed RNA polymerase subunit M/transcription elongation factor TFIIS